MKTIFDQPTREELIQRIQLLSDTSRPLWGKMNIFQMLRHCVLCEEMYLGKRTYKRALIGRIFGRMGLRQLTRDERPLRPNSPTSPAFKIKESTGDVSAEKNKWISLIREYGTNSEPGITHWFFGKMTREQVGVFVYKHTDHHLRQFNV